MSIEEKGFEEINFFRSTHCFAYQRSATDLLVKRKGVLRTILHRQNDFVALTKCVVNTALANHKSFGDNFKHYNDNMNSYNNYGCHRNKCIVATLILNC